jgi:phosphoglycolate phosphatase
MQTISADSVIFDLDGTLWDASASCTTAWNEALKQIGCEDHILNEAIIRSFSGLRIENIFDRYFQFISEEKHADLVNIYKQQESIIMKSNGGILYPHVKITLGKLQKKLKLFIVSNCLTGYIENFMDLNQFSNTFTDFECSGNTNLSKSENIQLVIRKYSLHAPVYVGDTIWDFEASMSNHIPFIYAAYGFGRVENILFTIHDLSELPELFGII